jgi:hypothetical protein
MMRHRATRANSFRWFSALGVRYRHSPIVGAASNWTGALKGGDRAPDGRFKESQEVKTLQGLFQGAGHHLLLFSGTQSEALDDEELKKLAADFRDGGNSTVRIHKISNKNLKTNEVHHDLDGVLHRLYGFDKPGFVLVRPDGYISFIGTTDSMDELKQWTNK